MDSRTRSWKVGWTICWAGALLLAILSHSSVQAQVTAYVGATLIDPATNSVVENGVILVEGGKIIAVGNHEQVHAPNGAHIVTLNGKWIVPGYIDVHTHLGGHGGNHDGSTAFFDSGDQPKDYAGAREEIHKISDESRSKIDRTLARHVRSGTTTILDVGGEQWTLDLRKKERGELPAPRILASGHAIYPGEPTEMAPGLMGDTPDSARQAVRRIAAHKPDFVKIYMAPVARTGWTFEQVRPLFEAAIQESHDLGLRTTAHAMQLQMAAAALEAGIDTYAHGILNLPMPDDLLQAMREKETVLAPTLMVTHAPIAIARGTVALGDTELAWGDPFVIADLISIAEEMRARMGGPAGKDWQPPNARPLLNPKAMAIAQDNVRRMRDAGVPLAVGTDAGFIGVLHGPSIHQEFSLLQAAGLTPMEVLAAATHGGARFLGRGEDLGRLAAGAMADLVVLNADPLTDIRHAADIYMVLTDGRAWLASDILPVVPAEIEQQKVNRDKVENLKP